MSSSVYFKFKSQKEPTRVEFDGTGISVFELKRDIIIKSGLGDGTDFDLAIYTEDGKEEYDDDTTIIPRSTTVVARRLPPMKPGAGRAARYVSGKMPVNAKNASRREQTSRATAKSTSNAIEQMHKAMTEEEKLNAMFVAQTEQWNAQQEEMSHQTPIFKPGARRPANVPDHDPPTGYICYRCGEKGHWIQLCPTNDNPEFDNRPRVKRTTGIPRSFLKTVDKAAVLAQAAEDDTKAPTGIMVNADGDFVIAEPDKASWEKFQAKAKSGAAAQEVADRADKELQDRGLECPIDKKLFIDPMQTPCCEKTYCNDCITTALIESDFVCPGCQSEGVLIDNLKRDEEAEKKMEAYQKEKAAAKDKATDNKDKDKENANKSDDGSASAAGSKDAAPADASQPPTTTGTAQAPAGQRKPSPGAASTTTTTTTANGSAATGEGAGDASRKSGSPPADNTSTTSSKKRPAESEAENPKIPKAPKAMQQQQQHKAQANNGQIGDAVNGFGMNGMGMGMGGDMSGMAAMNGMGMGMGMMPFGGMPMMGFGMGMGGMGGMNGMNGMGMNGMGGMGGMGGNMGNMNMMMGMNGAGNGYNGGYNNGMNMNGGRFNGGYNNGGGGGGGGYNNGGGGYNSGYGANGNGSYNQQGWGNRNGGGFQQQNRYNSNNGYMQGQAQGQASFNHNNNHNNNSYPVVSQPLLNGQANENTIAGNNGAEDDAYFRKPVNPNRHFNKPKRVRPSDYREL